MRKILSLFGALVLLALAWAAGHDITSGEPDVWMEQAMLVIAALVAAIALARIFWKKTRKNR